MTPFHEIKTNLDSHPSDVTVILPFEGQQNIEIEEMIERLRPDAGFIDDLMLKVFARTKRTNAYQKYGR